MVDLRHKRRQSGADDATAGDFAVTGLLLAVVWLALVGLDCYLAGGCNLIWWD